MIQNPHTHTWQRRARTVRMALAITLVAVAGLFVTTVARAETGDANQAIAPDPAPTAGVAKIHILAEEYMDAIVLESTDANGDPIFGIVDSGQGDTWPDGSDPRYPDRPGITKGGSIQQEMINYLTQLGVTTDNLEFYLGTHVHSDHIGTAQAVIRTFSPKRVYAQTYRDSLLNTSARLWDNLYQYDQLRKAASAVSATFIQYFDPFAKVDPVRDPAVPEQPTTTTSLDGLTIKAYTANPAFELGDMELTVMHYTNVDAAPNQSVRDANSLSLGVKVVSKTTGYSAFLSGDIDNYESSWAPFSKTEDTLATQLGHIDFLKLGHHGIEGSNTPNYLKALSPKVAYMTGNFQLVPEQTYTTLASLNTRLFQAHETRATGATAFTCDLAVSQNGSPAVYDTGNTQDQPHLRTANDGAHHTYYYVNGLPVSTQGLVKDGDSWALFDNHPYSEQSKWMWHEDAKGWSYCDDKGLVEHTGWAFVEDAYGNHWYFFTPDAIMLTSTWYEDPQEHKVYYVDGSGYMQQGWSWVDNAWHYFHKDSGWLYTGWEWIDGALYFLDPNNHGAMATTGWNWIDNAWHYQDGAGHTWLGWCWVEDGWYYNDPNNNGAMYTGWNWIESNWGKHWYYLGSSGKMATGWTWADGAWYALSPSGDMLSGWNWIESSWGKHWYYLASSGPMMSGWIWDAGHWYYCYRDGSMAFNTWIDAWWLNVSGVMA